MHKGLHGEAVGWWGRNNRQIAQATHRHVQRAWNRGGGQREQVHIGTQFFQGFFLAHAKALFFIDDHQSQIGKFHVRLQQAVGADDDIQFAFRQFLQFGFDFFFGLEA